MYRFTTVSTDQAPAPLGHYSQAIRAGGFIHISGQLPITPGMLPDSHPFDFREQAERVMRNFISIVHASGAKREDVVKVTAYVVGVENWPEFNRAFSQAFGYHRPARSVVPVPDLHHGFLIEVDGVALDTGEDR